MDELETLRMLLRASPAAIFWSDFNGDTVQCHGRFYESIGLTLEEVSGAGWARMLHPEDRDQVLASWRKAVAGQAPFELEYRVLAKDGSARWVLAQAKPIFGCDGGFTGHVGSVTDITDRKRLDAALRESEERYRCLYLETPAMLHSIDADGRLISVSNHWLKALGYRLDEVLGRRLTDFFTEVSRRYAIETVLPELVRRGACHEVPYQLVKKNGEILDVLLSAIAQRDSDGRLQRSFTVLVDVTARRKAETEARVSQAQLRALIDNSPRIIFIKDVQGRYMLVNREFERHHGLGSDDVRGKTAHQVFPADEADVYMAHDRETLAAGIPTEREIVWDEPDGQHAFLSVKFPVFDTTGTAIGLGCIETDISEQKRAERDLRAAKEQAERATHAKSKFLANMSHELRTPLNAIIGFSEMMKNELFGALGAACYREYASDIYESGVHLLDLINDVLDLSKVEAGKFELNEEECDLGEVVLASARYLLGRIHEKGLHIEHGLSADLPKLWADRRLLKQILLNLLSNAVKFTPEGGRITVTAHPEDGGILLAVADNGIGMDPADIPKALEPFEQVDNALSRRYEGSGLGLPLAKAFAELHGGVLAVESAIGVGTTVTLRLPASRTGPNSAASAIPL